MCSGSLLQRTEPLLVGLPAPVVTPASASGSGVQRSSDLGRSEIFQFSAYAGRAAAVAAEHINHVRVWIRPMLLLGPGLNLRQHLLRPRPVQHQLRQISHRHCCA